MMRFLVVLALIAAAAAVAEAAPVKRTLTTTPTTLSVSSGKKLVIRNLGPKSGPQVLCRYGTATTAPASPANYDFYVSVEVDRGVITVDRTVNCRCAAGSCSIDTESVAGPPPSGAARQTD